jgi:hypothetical protein
MNNDIKYNKYLNKKNFYSIIFILILLVITLIIIKVDFPKSKYVKVNCMNKKFLYTPKIISDEIMIKECMIYDIKNKSFKFSFTLFIMYLYFSVEFGKNGKIKYRGVNKNE